MQTKNRLWVNLSILFMLLSLAVQSCVASHFTLAPTLTLASSNFVHCAQATPFSFSIPSNPKVIYVLIDRSGSYGAYTKRAVDTLIEALKLSIEPGDRLHLIWLGAAEDDSQNWLVKTVPEMGPPLLTPPISTFTPGPKLIVTATPSAIPTPYITYPVLEQQALQQTTTAQAGIWTVTADASSVIATNTAIQVDKDINKQYCDQASINNHNQKLIDDWQAQRKQLVKDFIEGSLMPLKSGISEGSDLATHIYNSLYYSARTIRQEKDTNLFRAYYLIILSDMEDAGSLEGQSLVVDLSDVHVLMAMVYCKDSILCQKRSDYWGTYFKDRGAILPTYSFRLVAETTPYVLSDFLK